MNIPAFDTFDSTCKSCNCPIVKARSFGRLCRGCHEREASRKAREHEELMAEKAWLREEDKRLGEDGLADYYAEIDDELKCFDPDL